MKSSRRAPTVHYPPARHPEMITTADGEYDRYSLFYLGGPAFGVDNWQKTAIDIIGEQTKKRAIPTNIFNPRRDNPDQNASLDWEIYRAHEAIGAAITRKHGKDKHGVTNVYRSTLGGALFWFPKQTVETSGSPFAMQGIAVLSRIIGHYIQVDSSRETVYGDEELSSLPRIIIGMEPDFTDAHPTEGTIITNQARDMDIPVWDNLSWACRQLTHEEV